jgi:flagellar hook-basal body complex protein FliE
MQINALQPINQITESPTVSGSQVSEGAKSFQQLLQQALSAVNGLQQDSQLQAGQVAAGDADSFHEAVIASEKASLALQLAVQVQGKVIDAYNKMMQMQF